MADNAGDELLAPDLLFLEVGNAIWKAVKFGGMPSDEATIKFQALHKLGISGLSSEGLSEQALDIAMRVDTTTYDATYIALARQTGATLVTGDSRLATKSASEGVAVITLGEWDPSYPGSKR